MATITDLKLQKNTARANVYIDGSFACGMELSTIVKNGLKIGSEITKDKLEKMQAESEIEKATEKALSLLERQKYTKKQIKTKLFSKGYLPATIDQVIKKLEEYGYISDSDFAESFLRSASTKSTKEIRYSLLQKGVSEQVVNQVLEEANIDETEKIVSLAEKFMRYKEDTPENKKKLLAYLYRKGFPFDKINKVVKNSTDDFYE